MREWLWLAFVGACLLSGGCSASETKLTQVLVAVDADDDVASSLSRVQIETYAVAGQLISSLSYAVVEARGSAREQNKADTSAPESVQFPFSVGVVKRSADQFLLVVTGFVGEEPVIERKVLATFVAGQVRAFGIVLETPCLGRLCGNPGEEDWLALTCQTSAEHGAQCEAVQLEETVSVAVGTELDASFAELRDAGAEPEGASAEGGAEQTSLCSAGNCPTCTPGDAPRCRGSLVEECSAAQVWQVRTACEAPTPVCVQGECRVCEPDTALCVGTTRQVCDASGSAWAKQSVTKDVCSAACDPGSKRCIAQVVQRCDALGSWSDPSVTVGECGVVCNASEQGCAGTQPRTCTSDGSAWIPGPVMKGTCGAECEPGASECNATQTRTCSAAGQWSPWAYSPPSCGAICVPDNVRCEGTSSQGCSADGSAWNDQPPQAGTCDCSKPAPPGFGESCGDCGGKVQCDGSCSVATPMNLNEPCGSCGGKLRCDGSCSVSTPSTYNEGCGSCGGQVLCDGTCSIGTPDNINQDCGSCGGKVLCDGTCSVATPVSWGQPCGDCGGTWLCNGACSTPTFPDDCPRICCDTDDCGRCTSCVPKPTLCDFNESGLTGPTTAS